MAITIRLHLRLSQELAGREASDAFEETSEVVGIIEAEEAGSLVDVVAVHQQALGLVDDVFVNVADGSAARSFFNDVAKVTG